MHQDAPDSKARHLLDWLHKSIQPNGNWSDDRVIIFTEYRDTQNWLQTMLAAEGLAAGERLMTLHGGMKTDEREGIKAAFQASPDVSPVRILLATDAASEGIDLQLHCHQLIHYEIPWNPNRMEQRNGRIDRHGQRQNPLIYHFAPSGYGRSAGESSSNLLQTQADAPAESPGALEWDLEFLLLAVRKVEQIREDLGNVGPVIADQVTEAMLGQRSRLQTLEAEKAAQPARQMLKFERDLESRIERIHEQLQDTKRELFLTPENIRAVVDIALELAGQPALLEAELPGIWPDPSGHIHQCPVFHVPPLHGPSWSRCAEGLAHPHTGEMRPIVFDHNLARSRDDVVLAHLNHRLVQMCLRLLRAEVWGSGVSRKLHRVVARTVPDHVLRHPAMIAHARLVVIGGDSQRLHEEIIYAGGQIRQQRFRRFDTFREINDLMSSATDWQPSTQIKQQLAQLWPYVETPLTRSLAARRDERFDSLLRHLEQRKQKELEDIQTVLDELARSIEEELDDQPAQLSLFDADERDQYRRNVNALEARLAQIPDELEAEQSAIRRRYIDPQARMFPISVTFLVPERQAQ